MRRIGLYIYFYKNMFNYIVSEKLKGHFKETVTTILHLDNGSILVDCAHMGYNPLCRIKSNWLT